MLIRVQVCVEDSYEVNVKMYEVKRQRGCGLLFNPIRCTVMVLLREMNPSSVRRRGARQMKRRVYTSKVCRILIAYLILESTVILHHWCIGPKPCLAHRPI